MTSTNLFGGPRIIRQDGTAAREPRETEFEVILSLGLPTRVSWLEFTIEAIFLPFDGDSTPELEFETNLIWLPAERTGSWLSSHFDLVDKFSAAERPTDGRAYTHKLNFELDTSVAIFNWLPEGRWLRGVEVEGSLDYIATGLARRGEILKGVRFVDKASPWAFSIVLVLPVGSSVAVWNMKNVLPGRLVRVMFRLALSTFAATLRSAASNLGAALLLGSLLRTPHVIGAQEIQVPALTVGRPADGNRPAIDGRGDDDVWSAAKPFSTFIQQKPNEGAPATELTEIRFLLDERNFVHAR